MSNAKRSLRDRCLMRAGSFVDVNLNTADLFVEVVDELDHLNRDILSDDEQIDDERNEIATLRKCLKVADKFLQRMSNAVLYSDSAIEALEQIARIQTEGKME